MIAFTTSVNGFIAQKYADWLRPNTPKKGFLDSILITYICLEPKFIVMKRSKNNHNSTIRSSCLYSLLPILTASLFFLSPSVNADIIDTNSKSIKKLEMHCITLCEQFDTYALRDTFKAFLAADKLKPRLSFLKDKTVKARVMRCLGDCAEQRNRQTEAIDWYRKAMELLSNSNDKASEVEYAIILMRKGLVYQKNGDLQRANELYLEAEKRLSRHKKYDQLLILYPKIGDIYLRNQLDTVMNKHYILKAEAILPFIKDSDQIANFYIVKANTLFYGDQANEAMQLVENAIHILKRAEQANHYLLGTAYYNMAYFLRNLGRLREAEDYYRQSLRSAELTGIRYDIADALIRIGGSLYYQERFDEANVNLQKGLAVADSIGSKILMRNAFDVLSYLEYERGNFQKAYEYLDQYVTLHMDILSEQEQANINFLHAKYEDEKKLQQIEKLKARNTRFWVLVCVLVLVFALVLLTLLYRQRNLRIERRLAQERVSLLEKEKRLVATQAIMEGETAERSRLARDLHDGLGGMLSVIKLNLHQVKKSELMSPDDANGLEQVLGLIDQSMQELRRVAHNMMPEALVKYGLKTALADFCQNIDKVQFHYFGEEKRLDSNLEVTVYRTAFELMNNALKHADASAINIQVVQHSDKLALTVHDNGKGFDVEAYTNKAVSDDKEHLSEARGHGLANIKARASAYGGNIDIFSAPGQGTEITVEFTLRKNA